MEVSVLIERLESDGFRATGLALDVVSEAPTREAALEGLSQIIRERFGSAELVRVQVPLAYELHPWKAIVGRWREHPDVAEVAEPIGDYRRQVEEDGERP